VKISIRFPEMSKLFEQGFLSAKSNEADTLEYNRVVGFAGERNRTGTAARSWVGIVWNIYEPRNVQCAHGSSGGEDGRTFVVDAQTVSGLIADDSLRVP